MGMIKEFKEFAMKGNVIDLAVGIIIGAAFGKITTSLVNDVLMPPIGLLLGGVDFSTFALVIKDATPADPAAGVEAAPAVAISYGLFINATINFIIVAFAVFMLVKVINSAKRKEQAIPPAAPTTKICPQCCSDIPLKAVRCPQCTSEIG